MGEKVAHPGQAIVDQLGSGNPEVNKMNAQALQAWYEEYSQKRKAMGVVINYKDVKSTVSSPVKKV